MAVCLMKSKQPTRYSWIRSFEVGRQKTDDRRQRADDREQKKPWSFVICYSLLVIRLGYLVTESN